MARHETDREDLMREATALERRCELQVPGMSQTVIAGLRADSRLSIYFGAHSVYHFDDALRLRRLPDLQERRPWLVRLELRV